MVATCERFPDFAFVFGCDGLMMRLCADAMVALNSNTEANRRTEMELAKDRGFWFILLIIGATSTKERTVATENYAT